MLSWLIFVLVASRDGAGPGLDLVQGLVRHVASEESSLAQTTPVDRTDPGPKPPGSQDLKPVWLDSRACWEDQRFKQVRKLFNVQEDFLDDNIDGTVSPASKMGKSGNDILHSKDKKYVLKTMSDNDWTSLHTILHDYIIYMKASEFTLLPRFFTACQVHKNGNWEKWLVMYDWTRPDLHPRASKMHVDLKGTKEDRLVLMVERDRDEKQIAPAKPMWSNPGGKDKNFAHENIWLSKKRRDAILETIAEDTKWLKARNLMDYSLILHVEIIGECDHYAFEHICPVGIPVERVNDCPENAVELPKRKDELIRGHFQQYNGYAVGVRNNVIYAYSFGIIDILQDWVFKKKAAQLAKQIRGFSEEDRDTVPPEKYQERFERYFTQKINSEGVEEGEVVRDPTCECDAHRRTGNQHTHGCEILTIEMNKMSASKKNAAFAILLAWWLL
jgi:hypothetical protein